MPSILPVNSPYLLHGDSTITGYVRPGCQSGGKYSPWYTPVPWYSGATTFT